MKKSASIFKEYLDQIGAAEFIPFGAEGYPTEESSQFLRVQLERLNKANNYLITIALIMLCSFFFVGLFFIISFRNHSISVDVLFGGNIVAVLFLIVSKLRQYWIEKFIIDGALIVLTKLEPERAAVFIITLYSCFIRKKDSRK